MTQDDLIGFKDLKKIEFHHSHDAYMWGSFFVFARKGACWRLYNKEGYPFTEPAHSIKLGTFGNLECQLGSTKTEYDMREIVEKHEGLKRMILYMIENNGKKK